MTVMLEKSNIEKVLLFNDGIFTYVIYVFKDGTSSYTNMNTKLLADTIAEGVPIINVKNLAHG